MIWPDLELLLAFAAAATVLALTPGPDMAYVAARTLAGGRAGGVAAMLGVLTGILVHTILAALGLSALFVHSQLAFDIVKYCGAAYLVWVAIGMWREGSGAASARPVSAAVPMRVFIEGLLTNILNPKVALFFLALLPQFVAPAKGGVASQMIVLGLVMVAVGAVTLLGVVWMSAGAGSAVRASPRVSQALRRLAALLFVGLAIRLALAQRS
jgi:threonine/homoserine/homoserine lactone efflux protein